MSRRAFAAAHYCRFSSSSRTIKELDAVFLRQAGTKYPKWHLSQRLRPDGAVKLSLGASIAAQDLLGREFLSVVQDSDGHKVVLHEATLASYILHNNTRLATPIYPQDAHTIVSLLDLHPCRPGEDDDGPPLEIFEAGTGMGSLTLHIARALHAANPPVPRPLRMALCDAMMECGEHDCEARVRLSDEDQPALDAYAASRRAILHSLDCNKKHLHAAFNFVRNFRRAQYLPSIDFHAGAVDEYISGRLAHSHGQPFLSHAILDLPSAHKNAERLVEALHPNGLLIIFNPSISQVAEFLSWSTRTRQPLRLEQVLELPASATTKGLNSGGGGRLWDVRMVVPRDQQGEQGEMVQVLRPKVGDRVAGGGFVAVFRRWPMEGIALAVEDKEVVEPDEEDLIATPEARDVESEREETLTAEADEAEAVGEAK